MHYMETVNGQTETKGITITTSNDDDEEEDDDDALVITRNNSYKSGHMGVCVHIVNKCVHNSTKGRFRMSCRSSSVCSSGSSFDLSAT